MSIAPLDPPGLDAAGMSRLVFVEALADPSAPTVAEIKAGTDLSCALYGFVPSTEQSTVTRVKYCYRQAVETLGRATTTIESIEYDYDPQDPASAEYAYYAKLAEGKRGWLIDRRGLDARTADWEASQIVDVYPITLGARGRVAVDATAEGEKLRTRQRVAVTGEVLLDVTVAA